MTTKIKIPEREYDVVRTKHGTLLDGEVVCTYTGPEARQAAMAYAMRYAKTAKKYSYHVRRSALK